MTTSVVVLSHRPQGWLEPCLASVAGQADEVVLVDNGSPGGGAAAAGRRAGVRVLEPGRNLGFAAGVNLGVARARGDVVALLNDDAAASPGWLDSAVEILRDPRVAAVTPKVLLPGWWLEVRLDDEGWRAPGDERLLGRRLTAATAGGRDVLAEVRGPGVHRLEEAEGQDPARWRWTRPGRPFYVPLPEEGAPVLLDGQAVGGRACRLLNKAGSLLDGRGVPSDRGDGEPDDGRYDQPCDHFFASGTAVAFRAETWARVGGLAEPFFAYYEDVDWSWRARLAGLEIRYDPTVTVEHRQGATSGGLAAPGVQRLAAVNHACCLVRNAPLGAAAAHLRRLRSEPAPPGARRALARRLPWAAASRAALARRWSVPPEAVWRRWAGAQPG